MGSVRVPSLVVGLRWWRRNGGRDQMVVMVLERKEKGRFEDMSECVISWRRKALGNTCGEARHGIPTAREHRRRCLLAARWRQNAVKLTEQN